MNKRKIPVYILTGFLGSGKTTILLNMLEKVKQQGLEPGIILNEIGSMNVEGHFFQKNRVIELLDGCICCSIKEDLKGGLNKIKEEATVDLLFIEGTGIANPKEIIDVITDIPFIDSFEIYSIISVIDSSCFLEYKSIFSSSKEIRSLLDEQLKNGTLIIVNKMDLVDDKIKAKIRKKIDEQIKHKVVKVQTSMGKVDPKILLKKRVDSITISARKGELGTLTKHQHRNHSIQVIKINNIPAINLKLFEKWLQTVSAQIVRGKGVLYASNKGRRMFHFQFSSKQVLFSELESESDIEPCIILIGYAVSRGNIESSFWKEVVHSNIPV